MGTMKSLSALLLFVVAAVLALACVKPAAAQEGVSLFDASRRLSVSVHIRQVWYEGSGADIFDLQPELRQEPEGGLSLVWNLGHYLDANFGAAQGFESQRTRIHAGFTLVLVQPKSQ